MLIARAPAVGSAPIGADDRFFDELPALRDFGGVADDARYAPLPDDWVLAVADVAGSTVAIADGRYKAVNMAGAAVISAIQNALGRHRLPFVFGGDGALVAVGPSDRAAAADALARVRRWVGDELELTLRAAVVPVAAARAAGHDVRVARLAVSDHVTYAMFAGGGGAWADAELKAGRFAVPPAPPGEPPDLTGLSCRWSPLRSDAGVIVSVIAVPAGAGFAELVEAVTTLLAAQARGGHPVPPDGPRFRWPPAGLRAEVAAGRARESRLRRRRRILVGAAAGKLGDLTGRRIAGFDARRYRADTAVNADFRKFDDGLKLTVDLAPDAADRLERLLERGEADGVCRYGMHRQDAALMTCIVPSSLDRDHVHFVDGAGGGYALAAARLKAGPGAAPVPPVQS